MKLHATSGTATSPDEAIAPRELVLAWAVCLAARVAMVAGLGIVASYTFFSEGLRNAYWYPGYTALAETLWTLTAGYVPAYVAAHLVLHSLIGPIVYAIAMRLQLGRTAAWMATLGVAIMPYYASMAARQPQAGTLIVVFAATVLAFLEWRARDFRVAPGLVFGVLCFGVFTMRPNATPTLALLYVAAAGFLFAGARNGRAWLPGARSILASGLAFTALVGALMGVNWIAEGRLSPFPSVSGLNLYIGNNEYTASYLERYDIDSLQDVLFNEGFPAGVAPDDDAGFMQAGLTYMMAEPLQTLHNTFFKGVRYWDVRLERAERMPLYWNLAYSVPYVAYGLLALVGACLLWTHGQRFAVIFAGGTALTFCAPHLLFHGTIRHRMTTEFLLLVLAGHALAVLIDAVRSGAFANVMTSLGERAFGSIPNVAQRSAVPVRASGLRHRTQELIAMRFQLSILFLALVASAGMLVAGTPSSYELAHYDATASTRDAGDMSIEVAAVN